MSNTTEKNTSKTAAIQVGTQTTGKARYLTVIALMAAISYILISGSADAVSTVICQNGCIGCTCIVDYICIRTGGRHRCRTD